MDLKSIYSIACTVNRAETLKAKKIQNETLTELIKKSLKHDETKLIYEAIEICEKNNNSYEKKLIENHYMHLVSTLYTNEGMLNSRTDLVLFPILVKSPQDVAKMLSISAVENMFDTLLKEHYFLPAASNIHLYSVLFNKDKVNSMDLTDWYKLHLRMVFSREQSKEQNIYSKAFGVSVKPNKPDLYYFVGVIYQNRKLVESIEPELFDRRQMNLEEKKAFLQKINDKFKEFSHSTEYEVLMPDDIFRSTEEARFKYQEKMIHYFITRKAKIENTEFFIASLEHSICLFAYDNIKHVVYDKMKLYSYGTHGEQENIDNIFDALADNKTYVYIAKEHFPESFFDTSDNFKLEDFLQKYPYEKFSPNLLDNNDIYL